MVAASGAEESAAEDMGEESGLGAQPALGRLGRGSEDLEVEFLVERLEVLTTGGSEQFVGHVHQQPQIAGGVFAEGLLPSDDNYTSRLTTITFP